MLTAEIIAGAWSGLGARVRAQNRAPDAPYLRGRRPDFLDPVVRDAVRFAAVVDCSALEKLLPAHAETTGGSAHRSGKRQVMSVAYVHTVERFPFHVCNHSKLRTILS